MVTIQAKFWKSSLCEMGHKKYANEKTVHSSLFSQKRTEIPETFPAGINVISLFKTRTEDWNCLKYLGSNDIFKASFFFSLEH